MTIGYLQKNLAQYNNSVLYTNNTEALAQTPIVDMVAGGAYGGRLTGLSMGMNQNFQTYAYFKIVIDGVELDPNTFQQPSASFNTFNLVAAGDYWELPKGSHIKIYAYNQGGATSGQSMVFDVIITVKQYAGPITSTTTTG